MQFDTTHILLLIGGIFFTTIGGLAVFNDRFLKYWWMTEGGPVRQGQWYFFNRYGRGLGSLTLGVGMLLILAKLIFPTFTPIADTILKPFIFLGDRRYIVLILAAVAFLVYAHNLPKKK